MRLKTLQVISFRAHRDSTVAFAPRINLIHGPNGAGKTNLLEAIHFLALSKSFLASNDRYALRKGARFFEVHAVLESPHRSEMKMRLVYVPDEGKKIFLNQAPLERLSDVVGLVPVVIVSPADVALTSDGPEVRRRFLNNILSQARPRYLDDILQFRRALKQRNTLLHTYRRSRRVPPDVLESWNEELVQLGSRVIAHRLRFIEAFKQHLQEAYARIDSIGEIPSMEYRTIGKLGERPEETAIQACFREQLQHNEQREVELGRTLIGPHRDELVFRLNNLDVRRYASQGQHRTFGMALKLAQFFYLYEERDECPILLLDDVFGNLDPKRTRVFLEMLQTDAVGQCIVTSTDAAPFRSQVDFGDPVHRAIGVEAGVILAPPPN